MLSVNGYYDGNVCILRDKVSEKPQEVIVTFLRKDKDFHSSEKNKADKSARLKALEDIQNIWAEHDNSVPVDEYVRNMRKGRKFDI